MMVFILILPIIFFIVAFIVTAAMFRPEKRQKPPCRVSLE